MTAPAADRKHLAVSVQLVSHPVSPSTTLPEPNYASEAASNTQAYDMPLAVKVESQYSPDQHLSTSNSSTTPLQNPSIKKRVYSRLHPFNNRKYQVQPQSLKDDESQWGVHWWLPTCMVFLGIAGTAGALGHHYYNLKLDNQRVENADWIQRFALALAFFNKFCLIGAIQIAYKQRVWLTVKREAFSIRTINGLFSSYNDPTEFWNQEFLLKATIPAILAALIWLLPLCTIASPASLTSVTSISNITTICDDVPNQNFTKELGLPFDDLDTSLCFWDIKSNGTLYYSSPSSHLTKVAKLSLLSGNGPLAPNNPCPNSGNCSYTIQFAGPAYSCQEQPDFGPSANTSTKKSDMIPTGNYSYFGVNDNLENVWTGCPISWQNLTDDEKGTFDSEPDLWVGYVINTTNLLPAPITTDWGSVWKYNYTQHVVQCSMFNASYSYTISWLNGVMSAQYASRQLGTRVTSFSPEQNSDYRILAAYHAAGWIFRFQLGSNINYTSDVGGYAQSSSGISQTRLVDEVTQFAVPDFPAAIENEFATTILSLLSDTLFASRINISTPCTVTATELVWNYKPFWLVLSYSLAVGSMCVAVGMGVVAFRRNGYSADMSFSSIVATTRNGDLDVLAEGISLGYSPLPKHFQGVRLRFGEVRGEMVGGVAHTAFGLEGNVTGIEVGKKYA